MIQLLDPFLDPGSRTHVLALGSSVVVAVGLTLWRRDPLAGLLRPFRTRSSMLDVQLLLARQLLLLLGLFPLVSGTRALAVFMAGELDALGSPALGMAPSVVAVIFTIVLFVAWDASRFVTHWLMHRSDTLWAFHQVHHSADALTPLTFHRIHPVESFVYGIRGWLVTGLMTGVFFWLFGRDAEVLTVLGVHSIGLIFNVVSGNLRHSEVWWSFGRLEHVLISPAQHQLHHGADEGHPNYGTWLSIWDKLAGTFLLAERRPARFGLHHPNHEHDLLSAWTGPFQDVWQQWTGPARIPEPIPAPVVEAGWGGAHDLDSPGFGARDTETAGPGGLRGNGRGAAHP